MTAFADLEFQKDVDALHPDGNAPEDIDGAHKIPDHTASEEAKRGPSLPWANKGPKPAALPKEPKLKSAAPRMPAGGLAAPLKDMYILVGAMLSPVDPVCGGAIIQQAPDCAKALENLAKQNPEVRRVLVALVSTSAYGAVVTAHIPIILAVASHHLPAMRPKSGPVMPGSADGVEQGFTDKGPAGPAEPAPRSTV
jgi:hypothetical protein